MSWLTAAQIPVLILVLWLFTSYVTQSFPTITGKRICLLIAHPDDEAMFFAPILRAITRPELGNQVVILCFSTGDADGLGHVRKGELAASALQLGLRSAEHVVVLDDPAHFPDSMTATWDSKLIAATLTRYFAPDATATAHGARPPATRIDAIFTFDEHGVSGHPNHIALNHGATAFLRSLMAGRAGWECPVKLYTLTTTNVVRKYSSVLDMVGTMLALLFQTKEKGAFPTPLIAVSTPPDVRRAQLAMTTGHKSQMRWFRWGWIGISRYMIINDMVKLKGF